MHTDHDRPMGRRRFIAGVVLTGAAAATLAATSGGSGSRAHAASIVEQFDEVHRGRRVRGWSVLAGGVVTAELSVDGDAVHVMTNADGTFSTSVNHYESFPTLRAAALRAVDTLGGLRPELTHPHHGR